MMKKRSLKKAAAFLFACMATLTVFTSDAFTTTADAAVRTRVCNVSSCTRTGTHRHNGVKYTAHHSRDGHSYHRSSRSSGRSYRGGHHSSGRHH